MPSIGTLLFTSAIAALVAIVYQNPEPLLAPITSSIFYKIVIQLFEETHCYRTIRTNDAALPRAECISVRNGKFKRVFLDETSFDIIKEERVGHVIPGLWDGHGHLLQYGELMNSANLFGAGSMEGVKEKLLEYKMGNEEAGSKLQWLRGVGWDQANFGGKWPVAEDLEINEKFKDLFVMLDRVDVHCVWVSEKVLALLPDPLPEVPGGDIPARGIFCDNAIDLVTKYYPKPSNERKAKFIKEAMFELSKLGIVGIHDAGVTPSDLELYKELVEDDDWIVRVYAMFECEKRNTFCATDYEDWRLSTQNDMLHMTSVKLFADGALGSWGSSMIEPYTDKPDSTGSLLVNATTLTQLARSWAHAGYQVNIHAIGDLANRLAIDAFEAALKYLCPDSTLRECQKQNRFRIEHAQIIHPDDQRRMKEIGIIPSIQPTHATSDMFYAEDRLGRKRTQEEAYRMRSLLSLNPVFGSDFPVEPANPFEGMYAATTRRSPRTGRDAAGGLDGWYKGETVTLDDALEAFTVNPACAAFLENDAGTIKKGAWADWVVLEEPLETLDEEALRKVKVLETWVGGKMVYKRGLPENLPWGSEAARRSEPRS